MANRLKISGCMLFALWCVMAHTSGVRAAPPLPYSPDFPAWQQSVEARLNELEKKSVAKAGAAICPAGANCPCTAADCPKNSAVGFSVTSTPVRYTQVCSNGVCRLVPVNSVGGIDGLPDPLTGSFVGTDFGQTVMTVSAGGCGDTGVGAKRVRWHLFGKPHRR